MIRFRKLDTNHADRTLFKGHLGKYHTNDDPCYIAEFLIEDTADPLARITREKMAGQASCNMWGSP